MSDARGRAGDEGRRVITERHLVTRYFPLTPTAITACVKCGTADEGVEWFGMAYRKKELRAGRPDPGILCGACAGARDGARIGEDIAHAD